MTRVVFDYDWSLIDENSDTYVFDKLNPSLSEELRMCCRTTNASWTEAVNACLAQLECPLLTLEEVVAQVPVQAGMLELIRFLTSVCRLYILSDANTFYISSFLRLHKLEDHFEAVYTNGHIVSTEVLQITPYENPHRPHVCSNGCPLNLCKGRVMLEKLFESSDRVIYIGDGRGDFCAATMLRSTDVVLVRRAFGLAKMIERAEHAAKVVAEIQFWDTGLDLSRIFHEIFP